MRIRGILLSGLFLAVGLALGGCASAATPAATPAALSGGAATTIGTRSSGTLGTFLTGPGGMTLYVRTSDPTGGSSCTGGCASAWPPLTVAAAGQAVAAPGVTGTLATFARPDGTLQVTYNGQALYSYAADTKPGDTTGQGVGGIWFVAPEAGKGGPASPAASASPSGYGY